MAIRFKKIIKAILPYGIVVLARKYNDYRKYGKKTVSKEFVFDIILSVGITCKTAYYLKKHGLRSSANPLDWMMSYSLDTVIHLYKSKFNDFFVNFTKDEKEALKHNSPCWYVDTKNNIISQHYPDIKNNNAEFRKKMMRRFKRTEKMLLKAQRICFISCRNDNVNIFYNFLQVLGEIYPANITYINIRNINRQDGIRSSPISPPVAPPPPRGGGEIYIKK
jgi:hypothetical protein